MRHKKDTPIYSVRKEDEGDARDEISVFVVGLAERVDGLQDVELDGDLAPLRDLVSRLATDAQRFGFDGLAEVALQVADVCDNQTNESAQESMIKLTDIARRIRLGHRGAA